jgi:hypothetical protein
MKRSAILTMTLVATAAWAGEEVAGAKDHPLFTRYPDSFITEYTRNYNPRRERCRRRAVERGGLRPGEAGGRQSHRGRPVEESARGAGEEVVSQRSESRLLLPAPCGWKCAMPPCTATSD